MALVGPGQPARVKGRRYVSARYAVFSVRSVYGSYRMGAVSVRGVISSGHHRHWSSAPLMATTLLMDERPDGTALGWCCSAAARVVL